MKDSLKKAVQKAGIDSDKAEKVVDSVVSFLKEKLPTKIGEQLESLVGKPEHAESVDEAKEELKNEAQEAKDKVAEQAEHVKEEAQEMKDKAAEHAKTKKEEVKDEVQDKKDHLTSTAKEKIDDLSKKVDRTLDKA